MLLKRKKIEDEAVAREKERMKAVEVFGKDGGDEFVE